MARFFKFSITGQNPSITLYVANVVCILFSSYLIEEVTRLILSVNFSTPDTILFECIGAIIYPPLLSDICGISPSASILDVSLNVL